MSEQMNGLRSMRDRITRNPRVPTPPRKTVVEETADAAPSSAEPLLTIPTAPAPVPAVPTPAPVAERTIEVSAPAVAPTTAKPPVPKKTGAQSLMKVTPPTVQISARVPEDLDERLDDVVHLLGKKKIETSKTELLTMFLSELPKNPGDDLISRLQTYREKAGSA